MFGAGALAVHKVMVRPTIDIDFVVHDYKKAVELLQDQPGMVDKDLEKEKDGIQVAEFHFDSGVSVQIWDNNLYSLPMIDDSWSRVIARIVPGYGPIQSIGMEDLIISKVGRYTQKKGNSQYEAEKNVRDIVSAMSTLSGPDVIGQSFLDFVTLCSFVKKVLSTFCRLVAYTISLPTYSTLAPLLATWLFFKPNFLMHNSMS